MRHAHFVYIGGNGSVHILLKDMADIGTAAIEVRCNVFHMNVGGKMRVYEMIDAIEKIERCRNVHIFRNGIYKSAGMEHGIVHQQEVGDDGTSFLDIQNLTVMFL